MSCFGSGPSVWGCSGLAMWMYPTEKTLTQGAQRKTGGGSLSLPWTRGVVDSRNGKHKNPAKDKTVVRKKARQKKRRGTRQPEIQNNDRDLQHVFRKRALGKKVRVLVGSSEAGD